MVSVWWGGERFKQFHWRLHVACVSVCPALPCARPALPCGVIGANIMQDSPASLTNRRLLAPGVGFSSAYAGFKMGPEPSPRAALAPVPAQPVAIPQMPLSARFSREMKLPDARGRRSSDMRSAMVRGTWSPPCPLPPRVPPYGFLRIKVMCVGVCCSPRRIAAAQSNGAPSAWRCVDLALVVCLSP